MPGQLAEASGRVLVPGSSTGCFEVLGTLERFNRPEDLVKRQWAGQHSHAVVLNFKDDFSRSTSTKHLTHFSRNGDLSSFGD
jgi:hypothetical protein